MYQVDVVPYTMEQGNVTFASVGAGTTVAVYHSGTLTPATIYATNSGEVTALNPRTTTGPSTTNYLFYARPGTYDVYVDGLYKGSSSLGEGCDWQADVGHWESKTAVPYWTPLADGSTNDRPFNSGTGISMDSEDYSGGAYCVKVRAQSDRASNEDVFGDWTYLSSPDGHEAAFIGSLGTPVPCSPTCSPGYMGADDFKLPLSGETVARTPLFVWSHIAQAYWVIVARDPNFSNVVDYALTRVPAYAPRQRSGVTTYPDDAVYYWTVLPAQLPDGKNAVTDPLRSKSSFGKASVPPTLVAAHAAGASCGVNEAVVVGTPTFCWTGAEGAREYVLQAAADVGFTKIYEEVITNSTSYTSARTYDGDSVFWRVRANDELQRGLTWSAIGGFTRTLPAPLPSPHEHQRLRRPAHLGVAAGRGRPDLRRRDHAARRPQGDVRQELLHRLRPHGDDGHRHLPLARARPLPGRHLGRARPVVGRPDLHPHHPRAARPQRRQEGTQRRAAAVGVAPGRQELHRRDRPARGLQGHDRDRPHRRHQLRAEDGQEGVRGRRRALLARRSEGPEGHGRLLHARSGTSRSPRAWSSRPPASCARARPSTVSFKVTTFDKKNVYKAFVKASGKPLKKPTGARTNKNGVVKLKLKATKAGKITYTITKAGNQAVTQSVDVR